MVYWFARGVIAAIRLLPLDAGFLLGWMIGACAWLILPGYRRLARENMEQAFHGEIGSAEIRRLVFRHFLDMAANATSALKLAAMPEASVRERAVIEGKESVLAAIAHGRGVVLAINHIGNWELFAQLCNVIHPTPTGAVFQPLRNKALNQLIDEDRRSRGVETFDRAKGFSGAIALLRRGGAVGVLVDQSAGKAGIWMPFFHRLCSTSPLAAALAIRTGAKVVPVAIYTVGIARWRVEIRPEVPYSGDDVATLSHDINRVLESQIRASPKDWFWVHNRWKTPHPDVCIADSKRGVFFPPSYDLRQLRRFRIVIRSSNWLGDAVMSVPAVRAIRQGRPDAHVTILCAGKLADLWGAVPEVDAVEGITPGESPFAIARRLRGRFDVAILFPNSLRSALEVWLARIPRRIGYRGHRRVWLLDQFPDESRKRFRVKHHADRYLALARWIGAEGDAGSSVDWTPPAARRIGICPGAEYGGAKRWLPERFAEVIRRVDLAGPSEFFLVGVEKDAALAEDIRRQSQPATCHNLAGKTTLAELIHLLRSLSVLVTNDTGTMHLAAMLGVPTVAVFGSTDPYATSPRGPRVTVLYHKVECSPCLLRECPIDFRCMHGVSASEVVTAVEAALRP